MSITWASETATNWFISIILILNYFSLLQPLSTELQSEFMRAEKDLHNLYFTQYDNYQTYRSQGLTSFPMVHNTFHGRSRPMYPAHFSPTPFFGQSSMVSGSKSATDQTTTDIKLNMRSELYKRRQGNPKNIRFKVFKVSEGSFKKKVPKSSSTKPLLPLDVTQASIV